ncbi:hypothetical protein [Gloeocapsa sp. PCC 73106]|nr:hypothetical protein [Gloeocapsa sp. PCC 73106]ELR99796.1 hypothetical protein GLO73106DRAFT_00036480 [Gloeocapsa sp. PCC 73106]
MPARLKIQLTESEEQELLELSRDVLAVKESLYQGSYDKNI